MPDRITVAGPVSELSPISLTGLRLVSVKYPVSNWIALASTSPMTTAPMASQPRAAAVGRGSHGRHRR